MPQQTKYGFYTIKACQWIMLSERRTYSMCGKYALKIKTAQYICIYALKFDEQSKTVVHRFLILPLSHRGSSWAPVGAVGQSAALISPAWSNGSVREAPGPVSCATTNIRSSPSAQRIHYRWDARKTKATQKWFQIQCIQFIVGCLKLDLQCDEKL